MRGKSHWGYRPNRPKKIRRNSDDYLSVEYRAIRNDGGANYPRPAPTDCTSDPVNRCGANAKSSAADRVLSGQHAPEQVSGAVATVKSASSMYSFNNAIVAINWRVIAECKALLCSLHSVASDVRENRNLIEKEIHGGNYKLYSKNDDDLPALR